MLIASIGLAYDGKVEDNDDEALTKVMAVLDEGMLLAKKAVKEKHAPKKYNR